MKNRKNEFRKGTTMCPDWLIDWFIEDDYDDGGGSGGDDGDDDVFVVLPSCMYDDEDDDDDCGYNDEMDQCEPSNPFLCFW